MPSNINYHRFSIKIVHENESLMHHACEFDSENQPLKASS